MGAIPPQVLEELFTAPPSAFTKERNARAAALKKAGRHDAAEALRRLRRPNASLWATNQLGRLDAKRLAAFIDAVGDLRRTQLRDPRAAGEALRRQRAALDALLEAAGKHLADNGLNATPEVLRRISNTLQGAAVDRQRTDELRHGRLTEELSAPGFEVFEGAKPGPLSQVLRVAATGREVGFSAYDTLAVLGRDRCLAQTDDPRVGVHPDDHVVRGDVVAVGRLGRHPRLERGSIFYIKAL